MVLVLAVLWQADAGPPPITRGGPAPDFELRALPESEGAAAGATTLASLRGRVVLLNFWATWCEPCEREMPAMERLYQALPRDGFELVAVSIDEEAAPVAAFQDEYRLSFPILLDPDQRTYRAYQTMGVPESLLIDAEGRIVERYVGPREWDAPEYVARLEALMADGQAPGDG